MHSRLPCKAKHGTRARLAVEASALGLLVRVVGLHYHQRRQHADRPAAERGDYGVHGSQLRRQVHAGDELRVCLACTGMGGRSSFEALKRHDH